MSINLRVIDADGHVLEPPDLWLNYIEPKFREFAPRLVTNAEGAEILFIGDREMTDNGPNRRRVKVGATGAIGAREGSVSVLIKYAEGRPGGFDPYARIVDMDAEGIDAAFLYPSLGLFLGAIEDPEFAAAICRAYNRWLADYCRPIRTACSGSRCCRCNRSISPSPNWNLPSATRLSRRFRPAQSVQRPRSPRRLNTIRCGPRRRI